jgi:hypothetical protein
MHRERHRCHEISHPCSLSVVPEFTPWHIGEGNDPACLHRYNEKQGSSQSPENILSSQTPFPYFVPFRSCHALFSPAAPHAPFYPPAFPRISATNPPCLPLTGRAPQTAPSRGLLSALRANRPKKYPIPSTSIETPDPPSSPRRSRCRNSSRHPKRASFRTRLIRPPIIPDTRLVRPAPIGHPIFLRFYVLGVYRPPRSRGSSACLPACLANPPELDIPAEHHRLDPIVFPFVITPPSSPSHRPRFPRQPPSLLPSFLISFLCSSPLLSCLSLLG